MRDGQVNTALNSPNPETMAHDQLVELSRNLQDRVGWLQALIEANQDGTLMLFPQRNRRTGVIVNEAFNKIAEEFGYQIDRKSQTGALLFIEQVIIPKFQSFDTHPLSIELEHHGQTYKVHHYQGLNTLSERGSRIFSIRNITDQTNSEEALNAITTSLAHTIIVFDKDFVIKKNFLRLDKEYKGLPSSDEIVGKNLLELMPKISEQLKAQVERTLETGESQVETYYIRSFVFRTTMYATSDLIFSLSDDITEVFLLQEEYKIALAHDENYREQARLLRTIAGQLMHDGGNSAQGIVNGISIIRKLIEGFETEDPDVEELLNKIYGLTETMSNNFKIMRSLNEELRNLILKGNETITISEFDLIGLINFMEDKLLPDVKSRVNININLSDQDSHIRSSRGKIINIMDNLISNAAKYSDGPINVKLDDLGNDYLLSIQDFGIGIPEEEQHRTLNEIVRASNVGEIPGTGIGLTSVLAAANKIKGKVWFKSSTQPHDHGSTFYFQIPKYVEA